MLSFLRKHWFVLSLTALAIAAAAVVVFFPPAMVAAATIGLASSAAFAALGSFAVPAAIATVATSAAAAVYAAGGLLYGLGSLCGWALSKCFGKKVDATKDVKSELADDIDADDALETSSHSKMGAEFQAQGPSHDEVAEPAPGKCCQLFPKGPVKAAAEDEHEHEHAHTLA